MQDLNLAEEFDRLGPWKTKFVINGRAYGGDYDAWNDNRLNWFFEYFPRVETILELGSFEGGHTLAMASRSGVKKVQAIEGRQTSVEKARFVQQLYGMNNVEFLAANLETTDLASFGRFDAVYCVGLLYHLPKPWELIAQLASVTKNLFLWTHYADLSKAKHVVNGYQGTYLDEHGLADPLSGMSSSSFWPTQDGLLKMLRDHGFDSIQIIEANPKHPNGPCITLAATASLNPSSPPSNAIHKQTEKSAYQEIPAQEAEIANLKSQLTERTEELHQAYLRLAAIEQSAGWKIVLRLRRLLQILIPIESRWGNYNRLLRRGIHIWMNQGTKELVSRASARFMRNIRTRQRGANHIRVHGAVIAKQPPTRLEIASSKLSPSSEEILALWNRVELNDRLELSGVASLDGWALAKSGVERIEVYLDRQFLGVANYGMLRADVALAYPTFDDSDRSGFKLELDTAQIEEGNHSVSLRVISRNGFSLDLPGYIRVDNTTPRKHSYHSWIEINETKDILEAHQRARELGYKPLFSIVMPVYNTDARFLQTAIDSLRAQAYQNWELCVCNDGSTNPDVRPLLDRAAGEDLRIKIHHLEKNSGIADASNHALALATGEFITLMDHDDTLSPHALYMVAKLLNVHSDADFIYSDEDKVDMSGNRYEPFFKPDWSPDLFLSCNYIAHLTTIRATLIKEIGGFHPGYEGSQDYDLYLRAIEKTKKIYHIPKISYHWRSVPSSTASDPYAKTSAHTAAKKAIEDHLQRVGIQADVIEGCSIGRWRVKYAVQESPRVSIILPTGGKMPLLKQCLEGLAKKTSYSNLEIVIVDNSRADEVERYFPSVTRLFECTKYIDYRNRPFNYSLLNNYAVKSTDAPLVLFLNDDIVPINDDWLEAMVEHAIRPEVGAVGAKLIFPDRTIQHAGVVMGVFANSGHAFKYLPADERHHGYFDLPHVIRNSSAVTAACLMTRQEIFWQVGGFEEFHLAVAFQDVDLCLKMREKGYLIVYTPHARLTHYEAKTKTEKVPNPYEVRYMQREWAHIIAHDPYYNPNLTREREDFSLATP